MSATEMSEQTKAKVLNVAQPGGTAAPVSGWRAGLGMAVVLFKLRVVFLLVVAATAGAFLAAGGWPGMPTLLLTWITGGMAASGASASTNIWNVNQMGRWDERRNGR